jgi:hypothetical protein
MEHVKLWCRIFGHDFVAHRDMPHEVTEKWPSNWCVNCGLTRKDLGLELIHNVKNEKH